MNALDGEVNQSVLCFRRLLGLLTFEWLGTMDSQLHFALCPNFPFSAEPSGNYHCTQATKEARNKQASKE